MTTNKSESYQLKKGICDFQTVIFNKINSYNKTKYTFLKFILENEDKDERYTIILKKYKKKLKIIKKKNIPKDKCLCELNNDDDNSWILNNLTKHKTTKFKIILANLKIVDEEDEDEKVLEISHECCLTEKDYKNTNLYIYKKCYNNRMVLSDYDIRYNILSVSFNENFKFDIIFKFNNKKKMFNWILLEKNSDNLELIKHEVITQ